MALGASKWRTIATVIVPAASGGIVTGMLLSLARVAGETAPLLFTAFSNRYWSPGWSQPIASLPVMIYTYAIAPYDDWHRQAWAAGLVLLGIGSDRESGLPAGIESPGGPTGVSDMASAAQGKDAQPRDSRPKCAPASRLLRRHPPKEASRALSDCTISTSSMAPSRPSSD